MGNSANNSSVTASYATGAATSPTNAGGLIGVAREPVTASYAIGAVSGGSPGGLIGGLDGSPAITYSYYDRQTTGQSDTGKGEPKTTRELKAPTKYEGTIYANWNVDFDGDGNPDDPWDFGSPRTYPTLKVDFDGDGRGHLPRVRPAALLHRTRPAALQLASRPPGKLPERPLRNHGNLRRPHHRHGRRRRNHLYLDL